MLLSLIAIERNSKNREGENTLYEKNYLYDTLLCNMYK